MELGHSVAEQRLVALVGPEEINQMGSHLFG
jgi:hypothetical protein